MKNSQVAGIGGSVAILIVIASGFIPAVSVTSATPVSSAYTQVVYNTSVSTVTGQSNSTQTTQVYNVSSYPISTGGCFHQAAQLSVGMNVSVTWNAVDTVDVYVFTSSQYSSYSCGSSPAASVANQLDTASGILEIRVSASDTYHVVVHNGHTGVGVMGGTVELNRLSGIVSSTQTVTYSSYVTYTQTATATLTTTTTSTSTGEIGFWQWLFGQH